MRKEEFKEWLVEKESKSTSTASSYKSSINKISRHYSEQINKNIDLYNIDDILFIKGLVRDYGIGGRYEDFGQIGNATVRNAIAAYARFIEDAPKNNNNEKYFVKKDVQKPKNMPMPKTKNHLSESSYEIAQRVKKIILKINEIYKINRKKPIFNESIKLWGDIEKPCVSRDDFKIFSETLYNLFDKTRYKNLKYSRNNGEPYYISMLPKDFTQDNLTTTHFIFIVNTLRHYYVHEETDKIADVYEELLGHRFGPDSSEDFETLQKKVLSLFETSMKILLDMVKDE